MPEVGLLAVLADEPALQRQQDYPSQKEPKLFIILNFSKQIIIKMN